MDGGAWKAAVHGVTKSQTRLSDFTSLQKDDKVISYFITLFPLLTFPFDSFLCFKSPFFPTAQPLVTIILVSVTMS